MAIINCPECNGGVSDQADKCPHCGFKIPKKSGCLTMILVLIGAVIVFSLLGHTPENSSQEGESYALSACQTHITGLLKNPGSADFDTANAKVLRPKPDFMTIFITVRATNSFNAIVPADYMCFVRKTNGEWAVEGAEQSPQ